MEKLEFLEQLQAVHRKHNGSKKTEPEWNVSDEEWDVINYVYTWHPAISDTDGKEQIATIYFAGGYSVLCDMVIRARKANDLEIRIQKHRMALEQLRELQEELTTYPTKLSIEGDNIMTFLQGTRK